MFIEPNSMTGLILAAVFGLIFGVLLHRGGVANYNVIVNQFRLRDFTVVKIMLTAVVVGGLGVWVLTGMNLATWHIKPMVSLGVVLGAILFGIGMVVYGYCPGTGVAAVGTGSLHALAGFVGMLIGGVLYALTYPWIKANVLTVGDFGKVQLMDIVALPSIIYYLALAVFALGIFYALEKFGPKQKPE